MQDLEEVMAKSEHHHFRGITATLALLDNIEASMGIRERTHTNEKIPSAVQKVISALKQIVVQNNETIAITEIHPTETFLFAMKDKEVPQPGSMEREGRYWGLQEKQVGFPQLYIDGRITDQLKGRDSNPESSKS